MKTTRETRQDVGVWVGIDWGDQEHAVAVVSAQAELLDTFQVANTPEGYRMLDERLARQCTVKGVAVEATRHPLLLHLTQRKVPVYLVNPKMSKAWRDTDTISGAKSDKRDGVTLARGLAFRHADLRCEEEGDKAIRRLALLCEKECHLIAQRTALVQELKALLKLYFPAALRFFDDWTGPAAWDFLKRFPNAHTFAHANASTVIAFLKGHRLGYSEQWKQKVEDRVAALEWPTHPLEDVYLLHVKAILAQLHAINGVSLQLRQEIASDSEKLPHAKVVASLPGAGPKLAPRLMAIVGSTQFRQGGLAALRGHSGIAPVTIQSGKRKTVRIRHMCNKNWRNTMHLFAWCSTRFSKWARAFYLYRKACGDSHSTALRKLADKWMKILRRMLMKQEEYDEERYLRALQAHNSPICRFMSQPNDNMVDNPVDNFYEIA